ncbi:MAG: HAD family phosphatase [Planctomycetota bacterium]
MDALLFDFDGVIVHSEPIHMRCLQQVLETVGVKLTDDEYRRHYLGLADRDALDRVLARHDRPSEASCLAPLLHAKTTLVQQCFAEHLPVLPGALELIRGASAARVPLAICSGALRAEILLALRVLGLTSSFAAIVAAEDVTHAKPRPEPYEKGLGLLAEAVGHPLSAQRSIALEDSPAGLRAARAAGLRVVAIASSYAPEALAEAEKVVATPAALTLASLEALVR